MVVFPAPDGPTRATVWPGSATNEMPLRTGVLADSPAAAVGSSDSNDTVAASG